MTNGTSPVAGTANFPAIEDLLRQARAGLPRLDVIQARRAIASGSGLVDIRPAWQRASEGEIEGSVIVERNHLEWRLDRRSGAHLPAAESVSHWIVVCSAGFASSLAAASLRSLGIDATDLIGGVQAWRDAGAPLVPGITPAESVVVAGGPTVTAEEVVRLGGPTCT